jgi:hypothetical protein
MPTRAVIEPLVLRELSPMLFFEKFFEQTAFAACPPQKPHGHYERMELGAHQAFY